MANTQLERLDRAQNQALRRITGQTASCPLEALRLESGVQSYTTTSKRLVAASREKAYRLPPQHPWRIALEGNTSHRLCRDSWWEKSKILEEQLPADLQKSPLPQIKEPPWNGHDRLWSVSTTLAGKNRSDHAKNEAISIISNSGADLVIYTDGSAAEGTRN